MGGIAGAVHPQRVRADARFAQQPEDRLGSIHVRAVVSPGADDEPGFARRFHDRRVVRSTYWVFNKH